VKRCPVCGNEYDAWMQFCPRDSSELVMDPVSGTDTPASTTDSPSLRDAMNLPEAPEGRYRSIERLSSLPLGEAWIAEDTYLGRRVILLFAAPSLPKPVTREMILRYRALSAITHPNIETVFSMERIDGLPSVVIEYIESPRYLDDVIAVDGPFEAVRAARLGRQLASALTAIHEAGIIHKDVRPANLLLNARGSLKLVNFSQALVGSPSGDTPQSGDGLLEKLRWLNPVADPVVELAYAAPEQFRGQGIDERADIYGLGASLYHMLTGRPPHTGATVSELVHAISADAPKVIWTKSALETELAMVAMRCIEKRPEERYASADVLADALGDIERRMQIAASQIGNITPTQIAPPDILAASFAAAVAEPPDDSIVTRIGPTSVQSASATPAPSGLPSPGDVIEGRYRVDSIHGRGGMGAVYRATDVDLERPVAIKVLHPQLVGDDSMLRRFRQEARSAARLRHPNAVTVYSFGQLPTGAAYIAMEMIEGTTLRDELRKRGRFSVEEAAHILGQVADAVAAAHDVGLVHRDIKPDNIMLEQRPGGIAAKVLDFGIAKLVTAGADTERLTIPQAIVGTPVYMSPEQARGDEIDSRSDIYSLGIVLYEILSGQVPFRADTPVALALKHVTELPPSLRSVAPYLSVAVETVVMRTLSKDPAERPQTALDLAQQFWESVSTATAPGDPDFLPTLATVPSIVIAASEALLPQPAHEPDHEHEAEHERPAIAALPLRSLSADPEDVFFADGLSEEIITALSRLPSVDVVSRTSTARFRDVNDSLQTIGAALRASHVLEGSVRRFRNRVRITAQLADAVRDVQVWAETYDRDLDDVFAVQTEVARDIAASVSAAMPECKTCNMHPYDLWLEGRQVLLTDYFTSFDPADLDRAVKLFEDALALDSRFPDAWVSLGLCHFMAYTDKGERWRLEDMERCATRALDVDPQHAAAMAGLGWVAVHRWKPAAAVETFRRALGLNPGLAEAHMGLGFVYKYRGLWDAAEAEFGAAAQLNPVHTSPMFNMVDLCVWRGDLEGARQYIAKAKEIGRFSDVTARKEATIAYAAGDYRRSLELLRGAADARSLAQRASARAARSLAHLRLGETDLAGEALSTETLTWAKEDVLGAELVAQARSLEGDAAGAIEWLQRSVAMGNGNYPWISTNPDFAPLKSNAEFKALLASVRTEWERAARP
jgi:eukaryotic-like serine/threonine-protein kinase